MSEKIYMTAQGLELKTFAGFAYRGVDIEVRSGEVVAVRGRNGSGKTALLLTLAGRMKSTGGTLVVAGYVLPRQRAKIACQVELGIFSGLTDVQDSLTVAYAVGAEFELAARSPRRAQVMAYLQEWSLEDIADVRVKDITAEKMVQLGIALAFVSNPDAIVIDDVEGQLTMMQSERLMNLLVRVASEKQVAIVVGVIERSLADRACRAIYLSKEGE